jgi:hypothetical protein
MDVEGPPPQLAPPAVLLDWPLPGCGEASLADLCGPGAAAELARAAGPGGSVALDLGGRELATPAGNKLQELRLLCGPLAGLRSVALRNGTLSLRPGQGLVFQPQAPLQLTLERVKLVRPAPLNMERRPPKDGQQRMLTFLGPHAEGRLAACRFELAPGGQVGLPCPAVHRPRPSLVVVLLHPHARLRGLARGPASGLLCCRMGVFVPRLTSHCYCPHLAYKYMEGPLALYDPLFSSPLSLSSLTAGHAQQSVHLRGCLRL